MFRITIERVPQGDESRATVVAEVIIDNNWRTDACVGKPPFLCRVDASYAPTMKVVNPKLRPWRRGTFSGNPDWLNPIGLLHKALCAIGLGPPNLGDPVPSDWVPVAEKDGGVRKSPRESEGNISVVRTDRRRKFKIKSDANTEGG